MAALNSAFTCTAGHSFEANAKLRARCPECGVTARRNFDLKPVPPKIDPIPPKIVKVGEPKKPVLLKQGRPRLVRSVEPKKPAVAKRSVKSMVGAKVAGGLLTSKRIKSKGVMPTITRKPVKTAIARTIARGSPRTTRPFWHDVADKFGL